MESFGYGMVVSGQMEETYKVRKETKEPLVRKVKSGLRETKESLVLKAKLGLREMSGHKEMLDHKVTKVKLVHRENKVMLVHRENKVILVPKAI